VALKLNKATNAQPLDWTAALGASTPAAVATISGDLLAVSGQVVTLDVAGLLSGSAHFSVTRQTVTATLPTTGATSSVLLTVTLDNLFLAVGTPSIGAQITGGSLVVAMLGPSATTDHRSWVAFNGQNFS